MSKKFFIYLTSIILSLILCFYIPFKISYKKFSKSALTENKNQSLLVSPTLDKINKVEENKKNTSSEKSDKGKLNEENIIKSNDNADETSKETNNIKKENIYNYKNYFEKLKELGFYTGEFKNEDIDFRNAVLRFQSSQNITVDGIIGPKTKTLLMDEKKEISDTLPQDFPDEYAIVINKDTRILTVYKNKNIYKKYPIAAGRDPSYTPEGKFTIVSKIINPSWYNSKTDKVIAGGIPENPLGKRWLGLSLKGGSIYGIHGNNTPWSIGTNASSGCVRMINDDVEKLFDYIPINSAVWIGNTKKLNSWRVIQK